MLLICINLYLIFFLIIKRGDKKFVTQPRWGLKKKKKKKNDVWSFGHILGRGPGWEPFSIPSCIVFISVNIDWKLMKLVLVPGRLVNNYLLSILSWSVQDLMI